ncbi:transposase [Nonomuraea sp. NPDC004702]
MDQAVPDPAGRTRRPRRAGLVATRDRLGQRPGERREELTSPNPVDRGEKGSKTHLITERTGSPPAVAISAANIHDSLAREPLARSIPPIRSRRGPRAAATRRAPRRQRLRLPPPARLPARPGNIHRIARRGIESSQRLGRHRWVVERTDSWVAGCRRLHRRHQRPADHFAAFDAIAAALICYNRLTK